MLKPSEPDLELLRNILSVTDEVMGQYQPRPFEELSSEEYFRRLRMEPVLNIAGLAGGDLTGNQTMVPGEAVAKVEALLVPNQRSDKVAGQIRRHLAANRIDESDVELLFSTESSRTPPDHPMVGAIAQALERVWSRPPVMMNRFSAYSLYYLLDSLGIPGFYVAYAQPDQSNHTPNENLLIEYFMNGILSSAVVLDQFGRSGDAGRGHRDGGVPTADFNQLVSTSRR